MTTRHLYNNISTMRPLSFPKWPKNTVQQPKYFYVSLKPVSMPETVESHPVYLWLLDTFITISVQWDLYFFLNGQKSMPTILGCPALETNRLIFDDFLIWSLFNMEGDRSSCLTYMAIDSKISFKWSLYANWNKIFQKKYPKQLAY